MTEHFGFQLIPIPMHNDGPDMDMIEDLVQRDASIKGIWCVPKYQNPTGIVFSPMVVELLCPPATRSAGFPHFLG